MKWTPRLEFLVPEKREITHRRCENEDTEKGKPDFVPVPNLFNEWFAKDTSRKVKAAFKESLLTDSVSALCLIGQGTPGNQNKLIMMRETWPIVEKIFDLAIRGRGRG